MGSREIGLAEVLRALGSLGGDGSITSTVTLELRVPRTLLGILVGAALGVAGADPAGRHPQPARRRRDHGHQPGAAAFVVFAITVLGVRGVGVYVWFAFAGAIVAIVLVYAIASLGREGATPVKLALAGAAVTAGLGSVTTGIVMTNVDALNELRFWQVGSLAGRYAPILAGVAPFLVVGLVASLALRPGAQRAGPRRGHGPRPRPAGRPHPGGRVRRGRGARGRGHRRLRADRLRRSGRAARRPVHLRARLPLDPAVLDAAGPIVLLLADVLGRVCGAPGELQVGVVLGVLGAPAFVGDRPLRPAVGGLTDGDDRAERSRRDARATATADALRADAPAGPAEPSR